MTGSLGSPSSLQLQHKIETDSILHVVSCGRDEQQGRLSASKPRPGASKSDIPKKKLLLAIPKG